MSNNRSIKAAGLLLLLAVLVACGGGGGGSEQPSQTPAPPSPPLGYAPEFWASSTGSVWTFDGADRTVVLLGPAVEYRDRVSIGDGLFRFNRVLTRFNSTRAFNDDASVDAPQYRSIDGAEGIRAFLEPDPTSLDYSFIELPNEIRAGSYKALEIPYVGGTLRIDVNVVGFEPLSMPGAEFAARALRVEQTWTLTYLVNGQSVAGKAILTFWYAKQMGVVKMMLTDPSVPAPNNTITEVLAGANITGAVPGIRTGVVGDFDLLSDLAPVSSTLNIGRPGVASDGVGYLVAARSLDASMHAHIEAMYVTRDWDVYTNGQIRTAWRRRVIEDLGLGSSTDEYGPVAVSYDGANFWIVARIDTPLSGSQRLVRQRVTPAGTLLDGNSGVTLTDGGVWPALASDGANVLAVYGRNLGSPTFNYALYATLFRRDGTVVTGERQLADLYSGSSGFASVAFNAGEYLVAFERDKQVFPYDRDVFMKRLDALGTPLDASTLGLATGLMNQGAAAVAPWAADFVSLWIDGRNVSSSSQPERQIFGGRIRASDGLLLDGVDAATAGVLLDPVQTSRFGTAAAANAQSGVLVWSSGAYPLSGAPPPTISGLWLSTGSILNPTLPYTPARRITLLSNDRQTIARLMAPAVATDGTGFLTVWAQVEAGQIVRGAFVYPRYQGQ